jgi:serine/threonine protein kinase
VAVRLRREIQEAAASDEPLLISGPPGSDHEAVARAVHHQSRRAARAILCVSCLQATPGSNPSWGQTGGGVDVANKVRLADGGTLYLEGIQHLPRESQRTLSELLRGLDEARRAGLTPQPDVRVIASTTRDVEDEVLAGRLSAELHRALGRTLDVAPLRTRVEDLAALAPYILRRQAEQAGRTVPIISDASLERLKQYRWPGNLRELRNVLGAALAASHGPVLEIGEQLLDNAVRIGSYRLIEQLGAGGMGEVWLARHQLLARPAAVKIVREATLGLPEEVQGLRQRFAREAQATAELESPHTVQLFDFGTTDTGSFYYVMERLRGLDLQKMVERHGPLPQERVVYLLKQACRSLSEAHALGLVHRDIKPANLFICRLGPEYDFLKVLDFGVVSRERRGQAARTTAAGVVLGTPAYLAPELLSGQGPFDRRADIYGLGCVAFWMLTGRPPFEAGDATTLLMHHSTSTPTAPSVVAAQGITPDVDLLILDCLAKDPSRRPDSADILWDRLDALHVATPWDLGRAREWWEQHEPNLVG